MHYKELVAEGEKRQIHKVFETEGSQCPDKEALRAYYLENYHEGHYTKSTLKELIKEDRIRRTIAEYVAKRKEEIK